MSEKDLSIPQNSNIVPFRRDLSVKRASSFKIRANIFDFEQYKRTVRAFADAGITFNYIANVAESLGDEVERKETDVTLVEGLQGKLGEIGEDNHEILAWQARGERVSAVPQISSPAGSGKEIVIISKDLMSVGSEQEQTIEVLEGIKVSREDLAELENNPYLKTIPAEIKKAA